MNWPKSYWIGQVKESDIKLFKSKQEKLKEKFNESSKNKEELEKNYVNALNQEDKIDVIEEDCCRSIFKNEKSIENAIDNNKKLADQYICNNSY